MTVVRPACPQAHRPARSTAAPLRRPAASVRRTVRQIVRRIVRRAALPCGLLLAVAVALHVAAAPPLRAQDGAPPGATPGAPAPAAAAAPDPAAVKRGEYVLRTAGGCSCHTDRKHKGPALAGGRAMKTPFGTFYSTNLTPDAQTGLGTWSEADFLRAMRQGVGPQGQAYFPVFPYTSFTRMTDADLRDLWAYLRAQPPVRRANRPHDVWPPFGWRISARAWQWMFFTPARYQPDPKQSAEWNRGAYLVTGPAHCSECHTPRGLSGALQADAYLSGSVDGPEGELAPNITPDEDTGVGDWSPVDMTWFLETGLKPNGDDVQGLMAESIEHGYARLTPADRKAIAAYLRTVPPIHHRVEKP